MCLAVVEATQLQSLSSLLAKRPAKCAVVQYSGRRSKEVFCMVKRCGGEASTTHLPCVKY